MSTKQPLLTTTMAYSRVAAALVTASAVALYVSWRRSKTSRRRLKRASLAWVSSLSSSYWIVNVKIPIANLTTQGQLEQEQRLSAVVDHEGLVPCHVWIRKGKIEKVVVGTADIPQQTGLIAPVLNAHGSLLMPCMVDAHTHLTKTHTVARHCNPLGTMTVAMQVEAEHEEPRWKNATDVRRRMEFAVKSALHYGTMAMRTHLDGCASLDTEIRDNVFDVFGALQKQYAQQHQLILQGVANLWLPLWLDDDVATPLANRAAAVGNIVLGAYTGNPSLPAEYDQTVAALSAILSHAQRLQLDVDLHMDESNDPACCVLKCLCEALAKARQAKYTGRVVLGHVCALSLQSIETKQAMCRTLASLQHVYVVANPTTNLSLQDRRGSAAPQCLPIDANTPRTPQWRGLTLLQELRAAGVTVAAATDNVRDHWYPYGDYDLLTTWAAVLGLGHLETAPTAGHWADLCCGAAAAAMGLSCGFISVGAEANVILFPAARSVSELLARPTAERIVMCKGVVVHHPLPDFAELDDLMSSSSA